MLVQSGSMVLSFEAPGRVTGLTPVVTVRSEDGVVVGSTVTLVENSVAGTYRGPFSLVPGRYVANIDFGSAGKFSVHLDARAEVGVR